MRVDRQHFRFSRGVHPALAPWGVQLGLEYMRQWGGGGVAQDLVDNYPAPVVDPPTGSVAASTAPILAQMSLVSVSST